MIYPNEDICLYYEIPKLKMEVNTYWTQNKPPQNVPLWLVDNFELKVIKPRQTQEKLFSSP